MVAAGTPPRPMGDGALLKLTAAARPDDDELLLLLLALMPPWEPTGADAAVPAPGTT